VTHGGRTRQPRGLPSGRSQSRFTAAAGPARSQVGQGSESVSKRRERTPCWISAPPITMDRYAELLVSKSDNRADHLYEEASPVRHPASLCQRFVISWVVHKVIQLSRFAHVRWQGSPCQTMISWGLDRNIVVWT
jgi:hypothetical protein